MDTGPIGRWHRVRAAALGAVAVLATLAGGWPAWHRFLVEAHRLGERSTVRTLDALPVLLWAALLLTLLWAAVLITLAAVSVAGPGRAGGRGRSAPPGSGSPVPGGLIGRLAALLLAVTAFSSVSATAPAFATTAARGVATATVTRSAAPGIVASSSDSPRVDATGTDSCADVPVPGWVPDKPSRTDQVARACAPLVTGKPVADDSGEVVVHRGDTLWSIAAAHLGPHADAQAIAAEWPRWYAANKHTIGGDPDLLMIGIRLQSPDRVLEGTSR